MLNMSAQACPDGVLRLGYKIEFFPYFYWHKVGKFKGSLVNFWRAVSKMLGCRSYEFVHYDFFQLCDDLSCTKLYGGAIERGEIFAPVDGDALQREDALEKRYSTTVLWEKMLFLESSLDTRPLKTSPDLNFYLVYQPYILLMILVLYIIASLIAVPLNRLKRINGSRHRLVPCCVEISAGFIDILAHFSIFGGFLALMFIHSCYFKGNSVIVTTRAPSQFTDMIYDFARGKKTALIESGNTEFDTTELVSMFGSLDNVKYGDTVQERLEMVCADRSLVGFFYEGDLIYYAANDSLTSRCPLSLIHLSEDMPSPVQWVKDSVLRGDPYNFVYNRNISRTIVKKINFMLESVYTWDNLQGIILRRTIPMIDLEKAEMFKAAHTPVWSEEETSTTIEAMLIPIEFLFGGLAVSSLIFLIECVPFSRLRVILFR